MRSLDLGPLAIGPDRSWVSPASWSPRRSTGGVWAVTMVKNEQDIIATTITHLLDQGVERVVVADNLSTDDTPDILRELGRSAPVTVVTDRLVSYDQEYKMTVLARLAARHGASWILPFDADEIWRAPGHRDLASFFASSGADVVRAVVYDHVPSPDDDPDEADPVRRLGHRCVEPSRWSKVAFRAFPLAQLSLGNHHVRRPGHRGTGLEIRHFPVRSRQQYAGKMRTGAVAMAASHYGEWGGRHWRAIGVLDDAGVAEAFDRWVAEAQPVVFDPVPVPSLPTPVGERYRPGP